VPIPGCGANPAATVKAVFGAHLVCVFPGGDIRSMRLWMARAATRLQELLEVFYAPIHCPPTWPVWVACGDGGF